MSKLTSANYPWNDAFSGTTKFGCDQYHVVAFDLIKSIRHTNDSLALCFVKDIHVVGKKMTRNDHEITKCKGCDIWIWTDYI